MPPRTRQRIAHQHMGWASGSRKAPPSGRRKTAGSRAKRKYKRFLRDHPLGAVFIEVAVGLLMIAGLLVGMLAENALWSLLGWLSAALAAMGTMAQHKARVVEKERETRPPRVRQQPPAGTRKPPPPPGGSTPPPPQQPDGAPKCTNTGQSIDVCKCNTKHIRTQEGADYYRKPVGTPIGKPNKTAKGKVPL